MSQNDELFDALTCDPLDLIDRLGDDVDSRKWPERLHQMYELMRHFNLRRCGMDEPVAALDARDRCIVIGDYLGGRVLSLPRGTALRAALRDKQIWRGFTGDNHEALAARHNLDVRSIYRIIALQRKLYREAALQGKLFD